VFLAFLFAAILQARWIRSSAILPWILSGPFLLAVAADLPGLDVSGCLRRWAVLSHISKISCGMVTATLVLPLVGVLVLAGYLVLRLWPYLVARGEIAV
jgi:hypothetical protein